MASTLDLLFMSAHVMSPYASKYPSCLRWRPDQRMTLPPRETVIASEVP
jgi:hypothetical protein